MGTILFSVLVTLWVLSPVTSGITVPKEWIVAINGLCQQAEMGSFPNPSPHGQVIHATVSSTAHQSEVHAVKRTNFAYTLFMHGNEVRSC